MTTVQNTPLPPIPEHTPPLEGRTEKFVQPWLRWWIQARDKINTIVDGNKGDITVSDSGSLWTINNDAVTNAKLANMANARIKARKTSGTGDPEDCTLSEVLDFIGSAAQGDILYRGASAWARLPASTSGFVLTTYGAGANPAWAAAGGGGGGIDYGNAFPGSPTIGDPFFRTDLGWLCWYTASGWLTDFEIALPALPNAGFAGSSSADGVYWYHAVRSDYPLYLTNFTCDTYIGGTNNGSNYYTIQLGRMTSGLSETNIVNFNTSADTASTVTNHDQTINSLLDASALVLVTHNITKTGSPGGCLVWPCVYARLVVT